MHTSFTIPTATALAIFNLSSATNGYAGREDRKPEYKKHHRQLQVLCLESGIEMGPLRDSVLEYLHTNAMGVLDHADKGKETVTLELEVNA